MARRSKKNRIDDMQQRHVEFCHQLLKHWNATKAAVDVGFSAHSAPNQAHVLLKRQDVQELLQSLSRARLKEIDLDANEVLAGLARIATYDLVELVDAAGHLLPLIKVPEELRRCLSSVKFRRITTRTRLHSEKTGGESITETVTTEVIEVKMPDRLKAYELIGRHLQLFEDDKLLSPDSPDRVSRIERILIGMDGRVAPMVVDGDCETIVEPDEKEG